MILNGSAQASWAQRRIAPRLNRRVRGKVETTGLPVRASKCQSKDVRWHSRLFCYLVTCMQEGMFTGKKFDEMMKKAKVTVTKEGEEVGSTAVETKEESVLRKACKNAFVIATLMLADPMNQCRQRAILTICRSTELWHGKQNKVLRSCKATKGWLTSQLLGDFWEPLLEACASLQDSSKLEFVGLRVGSCQWAAGCKEDGAAANDDELATHMGDLSLALLGTRQRRDMWMLRSWSSRSVE